MRRDAHAVTLLTRAFDHLDARAAADTAQLLAEQRSKIWSLEHRLTETQQELDLCKYGADSVLGILYALPEWPGFDQAQRINVKDFLEHFPVKLIPGETTLIATPEYGRAEVIRMLGPKRVLDSMTQEACAKLLAEGPDEFAAYFGDLRR